MAKDELIEKSLLLAYLMLLAQVSLYYNFYKWIGKNKYMQLA